MRNKFVAAIRRWFFRHLPLGWQMKLARTRGHKLSFPVPMSDSRSKRILDPSELSQEERPESEIVTLYHQSAERRLAARLQNEA